MKILVLGSTGMLGHKMVERLRLHYDGVHGLSRQDGFDATDTVGTAALIMGYCPDVIINCTGIVKQRTQNPEESIAVNALFPHFLKSRCQEAGAQLIHFSTDCVFSGKRGRYTESDVADPEDLYGRTKYLGEISAGNALTIRTSIIGREKKNHLGLLEWFLRQFGNVSGFTNSIYTGVTTNWLADAVAKLVKTPLSGLYQVASPPISKYYLLRIIKDVYNLRNTKVCPVLEPFCDRSLIEHKFRHATSTVTPDLLTMVNEQYEQDLRSNYAI